MSHGVTPGAGAAYVVGSGPSIGGACVQRFARAGLDVGCIDLDIDAARAAAAAAAESGVRAAANAADVTDRQQVRAALAATSAAVGPPSVLVNVVGGSMWSLTAETSDEEWDRVFALNLRQQWVVAQEVIRLMGEGGGSIVFVASVSGLVGATRHGGYGAAKAGLISMTRTLAVENAARGIRVNAVAPGRIATAARAGKPGAGDASKIPIGRLGRPEDIASAVYFLASEEAAYVTGHVLVVDGGVSVRHSLVDF